MVHWFDLPIEIQREIILLVCDEIIDVYGDEVSEIKDYGTVDDFYDFSLDEDEYYYDHPYYPFPLRDFYRLMKTCKSFRQIVLSATWYENSVIETLQHIQYDKAKEIVDSLSSGEISRVHHSFLAFMRADMGPFWTNPVALEDKNLFFDLYLHLTPRAQSMFVSKLENFIQRHAEEHSQHTRRLVEVGIDDDESCHRWIFSKGCRAVHSSKVEICSVSDVTGISKPEEELDWELVRYRWNAKWKEGHSAEDISDESDESDNVPFDSDAAYDRFEKRLPDRGYVRRDCRLECPPPAIFSRWPGSWWLVRNLERWSEWHLVSFKGKELWCGPSGRKADFHHCQLPALC
jgi:hypothetical protein